MFKRWVMTATLCGFVSSGAALAQSPLPPPVEAANVDPQQLAEYGEELLRGPVHEAFAEQYNQDPVVGLVVDRAPPPAVPEIPPEIRPEGDNVEWLSGYWFWDDDRGDFLWVSGTWRKIPPGLRWLPGYWAESGDQYQWVAGSWINANETEIQYIAQSPPETLDNGPVGNPPSENHFWIPGCWTWQQSDYAWRPGYWTAGYSNWVWVPQRYLWTPRGYMFHNGYWDYPIANRGSLFAPFYFNSPVYARPGFFYSPRVSIFAALLQSHLWVRPGYRHYYFGDYYAANYRGAGIYPWHNYHRGIGFQSGRGGIGRGGFDPLFAYYSLRGRTGGGNFFQQVNNQYNVFVNQVDRRPSLTYRDQLARGGGDRIGDRGDRGDRGGFRLGESIDDLSRRDPSRYTRLSSDPMDRVRNSISDNPQLVSLRRELESAGRGLDRGDSAGNRGDSPGPGQGRGNRGDDRENRGSRPDGDRVSGDRPGLDAGAIAGSDRLRLPPVTRSRDAGSPRSDAGRGDGRYSSARPDGLGRAAVGRDAAGRDVPGRDAVGRDAAGRNLPGRDAMGRDAAGRVVPDRDAAGRAVPGRDVPGRDAAGRGIVNREEGAIRRSGDDNRPQPQGPITDRLPLRSGRSEPVGDQPQGQRPGSPRESSPAGARPSGGSVLPPAQSPPAQSPPAQSPSARRPSPEGAIRSGVPAPQRSGATQGPPQQGRLGDALPGQGGGNRPGQVQSFRPSLERGTGNASPQPAPSRGVTTPGRQTPGVSRPPATASPQPSASSIFPGGTPSSSRPSISPPARSSAPQSSSPQVAPGNSRPSFSAPSRSSSRGIGPSISTPQRSSAPSFSPRSSSPSPSAPAMRSGPSRGSMPSLAPGGSSRGGGESRGGSDRRSRGGR